MLCAMRLSVTVTGNKVKRPPPCSVMSGLAVRVLCVTALPTSASRTEGAGRRGPSRPDAAASSVAARPARGTAVVADACVSQLHHADVCVAAAVNGRGARRRRGAQAVGADDAVADRDPIVPGRDDRSSGGVRHSRRGRRGHTVANEARVADRRVRVDLAGARVGLGPPDGRSRHDTVVADRAVAQHDRPVGVKAAREGKSATDRARGADRVSTDGRAANCPRGVPLDLDATRHRALIDAAGHRG